MKDDPSLAPVTEVISDKSTMAMQSAVSLPLEIFPKNNGMDEDNTSDVSFHLGLSDAEEEAEKSETKSPKKTDDQDMDYEDAIIDKFDTSKSGLENVNDEDGDVYFDEKILDSPPSGASESFEAKSNDEKNETESSVVSVKESNIIEDKNQSDKTNGIINTENEEDDNDKNKEITESDIDGSNEKTERENVESILSNKTAEPVDNSLSEISKTVHESAAEISEDVNGSAAEISEAVDGNAAEISETLDEGTTEVGETVDESAAEVRETVDESAASEAVDENAAEVMEIVDESAASEAVHENAAEVLATVDESAAEVNEGVDENAAKVSEAVDKSTAAISETVGGSAGEGIETVDKSVPEVNESVEKTASKINNTPENTVLEVAEIVDKTLSEITEPEEKTAAEVAETAEKALSDTVETTEKKILEDTNDDQNTDAIPNENVEEQKSAEESNITKQMNESMDTENLLAVTTVKEVSEDLDNQENEKDDGSNENSCSSASEKDDMEETIDETVNDEIVDKEIDDVEMEEVGEKSLPKEEDTECMDVVDIEENNPLTDDVDTEMDKEYENLTKEDSSEEKQTVGDSEPCVTKTQSDITDASDIAEKSQTEVNKDILTSDSVQAADSVSVTNVLQSTNESGVSDFSDISSKPGKRTLSEPDLLKTSKKIKLTDDESLAAKKIKILGGLSEFMASKKLEKMSNTDLEEYCLQKICEVLIYKSEVADLRDQLQKQESLLEKWRKEYRDLAKQTRDLEIVHKKLMDELKRRPSKPESVEPVKITRSVGLQVKLYEAVSAASPMKRRFSRGQETPQNNNTPVISQVGKPATRTTATPTPQRQPKSVTPKPQSSPLLSQALQKDAAPQATTTSKPSPVKQVQNKGFIDLTEEDDKKTTPTPTPPATPAAKTTNRIVTPVNKTQTAIRSTTPVTQSIQLVTAPQLKPNVPGAPSGQRYMYLVNSPNVLTAPGDPTKPGAPKTLMLKFPNGILGQTNGILPTLQNGNSTISVLPQVTAIRAGQVRLQAPQTATPPRNQLAKRHPAPLPQPGPAPVVPSKKPVPPKPQLSIRKSGQGIVLSWKMPHNLDLFEVIASYQLYAYQETSKDPKPDMWRKVGDVKALALPMACTLTQFADGNKYYFAVRAVDVYKRIGAFSDPEQIML